jgi:hypothetical protein
LGVAAWTSALAGASEFLGYPQSLSEL